MSTKQFPLQEESSVPNEPIPADIAREIANDQCEEIAKKINQAIWAASKRLEDSIFVSYVDAGINFMETKKIAHMAMMYEREGWVVSTTNDGFLFAR